MYILKCMTCVHKNDANKWRVCSITGRQHIFHSMYYMHALQGQFRACIQMYLVFNLYSPSSLLLQSVTTNYHFLCIILAVSKSAKCINHNMPQQCAVWNFMCWLTLQGFALRLRACSIALGCDHREGDREAKQTLELKQEGAAMTSNPV